MSFQTTYGSDGRLRVAILGCTGSIGTQALDVCRQHADRLQVTALSVHSSTSTPAYRQPAARSSLITLRLFSSSEAVLPLSLLSLDCVL